MSKPTKDYKQLVKWAKSIEKEKIKEARARKKNKKYEAKGDLYFFMQSNDDTAGWQCASHTIEDIIEEQTRYYEKDEPLRKVIIDDIESHYARDVYSLMSGEEFLGYVLSGSIMNIDGCIAEVYVDGFKSNLGLFIVDKNFIDGQFLVDEYTFRDICKHFKVEVNWANK